MSNDKTRDALAVWREVAEAAPAMMGHPDRKFLLLSEAACVRLGAALEASAAPSQASEPAGWKLVPVEPTRDMVTSGVVNTKYVSCTVEQVYAAMLAAAPEAPEPARPDIIEKLTYHQHERDDMTLDDVLSYLASGWKTVHGRTERQLILQLCGLLAGAPGAKP